jgi:Leucine-rich repeat (LRR) protein
VQLALTVLDLSINNLHSLDEDLFDDLHDLHELYLSENLFVSFDMSTMSALNKLHSLKKLDISRNKLKDVYDGLSTPIKTLSTLNLAGNFLRRVPSVLQYGEKLTGLNLNENPIAMISEDSFKDLNMLQVLNMSVMPELEILEARAFEPLTSLQYLRCNYNYKLKYINSEVFGTNQPPLIEVDLSENHILTLDEHTVSWWTGDNLNLQNNPLFCDCHLTWIKTRPINPELMTELRCGSGPAELKDKAIIELDILELACDVEVDTYADDPVLAGLIIIAMFSVLVVCVAIVAIMRYRTTPLGRYATVHVRYSKPETQNYRRM